MLIYRKKDKKGRGARVPKILSSNNPTTEKHAPNAKKEKQVMCFVKS